MSIDAAPAAPAPDAAPTPEAPPPEAAAAPATPEATPPAPPPEPSPTKELVALQRQQRKLHQEREAWRSEQSAKQAELEAARADVEKFRGAAAKAIEDPFAFLELAGIDRFEFIEAFTMKALDEQPSADAKVNKLEKQLKAREAAEKAEREAAEKRAKEEAEKHQEAERAALIDASLGVTAQFVASQAEEFPALMAAAESTQGAFLREVVNLAMLWQDTHHEQLSLPKACEMVESRLREESDTLLGTILKSKRHSDQFLAAHGLMRIPPSPPQAAPPTPTNGASAPRAPADAPPAPPAPKRPERSLPGARVDAPSDRADRAAIEAARDAKYRKMMGLT